MQDINSHAIKEKTLSYHQSGMNGAQAVLQALMDCEVIEEMPDLIRMTSAWKGGIGGDTCSAYAAATLILGSDELNRDSNLMELNLWFKEHFGSISCPAITSQVGGRPSKSQKSYCDQLSADTADFVFQLMNKTK